MSKRLVGLLIVFLIMWLPFLLLSFYNVPIGMHEWDWMTDYAGRFSGSFWELQQHLYAQVMGRYTSNALLSLTSTWCTLASFPFFFFIWQIIWLCIILLLIRSVLSNYPWLLSLALTFGIQVQYLFQLEDVYDSLYRYTALLTYQAGTVCALIAAFFLIKYGQSNKRKVQLLIAGLLFMVLAIGTNEMSMLFSGLVTAVLFFYHMVFRKKFYKGYFIGLLIAILSGIIVVMAPGNELRMQGESGGMDIVNLLMMTSSTTVFVWFDWISSATFILLSILAIPFIGYFVRSDELHEIFNDFRPWLIILVLLVPASMMLLLYSTGSHAFPERVIDHLFIHVIFVWLGCIISLCERFRIFDTTRELILIKPLRWTFIIMLFLVLAHVFGNGLDIDRTQRDQKNYLSMIDSHSNILNAWLTLATGDAAIYYRQSMNELNKLNNCNSQICYMKKPDILPVQLYDPLSDRRNRKGDGYMGYYFNPRIKLVEYYPD